MTSPHMHLPADATQDELLAAVERFNDDPAVDGLLIQHPIPGHLDYEAALAAVDPAQGRRRRPPRQPGPAGAVDAGPAALHARRHRGAAGALRDARRRPPRRDRRPGLHPRPPAVAAAVGQAPDHQRRGHRGAHRRARHGRLHAPGRHPRRRRRRARHHPARAREAGRGRRRRRRQLRGTQARSPTSTKSATRSPAGSRRGSAASARRRSPCCSATASRRPSAPSAGAT